jgi:hypothetical protein
MTYVYESVGHWDKGKQQCRNERVCIGKPDPITGAIIPNVKDIIEMDVNGTDNP